MDRFLMTFYYFPASAGFRISFLLSCLTSEILLVYSMFFLFSSYSLLAFLVSISIATSQICYFSTFSLHFTSFLYLMFYCFFIFSIILFIVPLVFFLFFCTSFLSSFTWYLFLLISVIIVKRPFVVSTESLIQ